MRDAMAAALQSFADLAANPSNPEPQEAVGLALHEIRRIERQLSEIPPRRPFIQDQKASRDAAECLVRMADAYVAALQAASPAEAQLHGVQAQTEIDAANSLMDAAELDRELGERLGGATPQTFFEVAIPVLSRAYPGRNLLEIDAEMRTRLSTRLGREVAVGQGLNFAIAEILAKANLDVDRFNDVIDSASRLFESVDGLRAIANETGAVPLLLRARNAILESTGAFDAAMAIAASDEARLRRTVNLYRELFEDAGTPLFAWFLRISRARSAPIGKLAQEDSTSLLRSINARPDLAVLFVGADKNIRTAASHGLGYELVGDDVVFNIRSFDGTMTVEVIIDLLLALIESLLATFWVLDNELSVAGVEGHTSSASLMGTSLLVVAEQVLMVLGATVVSAMEDSNSWSFVLGPVRRSDPFIFAVALAANAPSNVQEISIECPDVPVGKLQIPQEAGQRFVAARDLAPMDLAAANLRLLNDSMLDGQTALAPDHLRRTACIAGVALLHRDDKDAVALLRECMYLARTLHIGDVVAYCTAALAQWRTPNAQQLQGLIETMRAWNELPVPRLPLARITRLTGVRPPPH